MDESRPCPVVEYARFIFGLVVKYGTPAEPVEQQLSSAIIFRTSIKFLYQKSKSDMVDWSKTCCSRMLEFW
jgi:hypothetical protein